MSLYRTAVGDVKLKQSITEHPSQECSLFLDENELRHVFCKIHKRGAHITPRKECLCCPWASLLMLGLLETCKGIQSLLETVSKVLVFLD